MDYVTVPGIAKPLSRLVQGCMMFKADDPEAGYALLDAAFERGITTFDNGHVYGGGACERVFGAWVRDRGVTDQIVMLAKGCHHNQDRKRVTPFDIRADIADTRARTGLEFLDVWLFHRDDPAVPVGPLVETCQALIDEGQIGAWGGSNWTVARLAEATAYAAEHGLTAPVCSSPNFSLAEQIDSPWGDDCITISGPAHADDRAWYANSGMTVLTWSSLARGFLAGGITRANFEAVKANYEEHTIRCYVCEANWQRQERALELAEQRGLSLPQIALAYVLNQPFSACALVGARDGSEMDSNIAALNCQLSADEIARLEG